MINHGRTLLINTFGTGQDLSFFGEHYIPPTYGVMVLDDALKAMYQALFGVNPDRAFLNFRAHELLTLIHSTELGSYLTDLDSRITYLTNTDNMYEKLRAGKIVTQSLGTRYLTVVGDTSSAMTSNVIYYKWTVEHTSASPNFTLSAVQPVGSSVTQAHGAAGTFSNTFNLIGNIGFFFDIGGTDRWTIELYLQPSQRIAELVSALETTYSNAVSDILGNDGLEPYLTFKNLWQDSQLSTNYRLSAVIVAFIYRLNEKYTGA